MTSVATLPHRRTCPLCEGMCGLRIDLAGRQVLRIRPDPDNASAVAISAPRAPRWAMCTTTPTGCGGR